MSINKRVYGGFHTRSLSFPREVGSEDAPNYITFRPIAVEYGKFGGGISKSAYGNNFSKTIDSGWNPSGAFDTAVADQVNKGFGGILDNLANGALGILKSLSNGFASITGDVGLFGGAVTARVDIGNLNLQDGPNQRTNKVYRMPGINLYMPPAIGSSIGAKYTDFEMGAMGMTAVDMIDPNAHYNSSGELVGASVDGIKGMSTALVNDISRTGKIGAAVQLGTGRVANGYNYTIFQGMNIRKFNYSFQLVAKSDEESRIIKDLCDKFMLYMLPARSTDDFHNYSVPCMWEIEYYHNGDKNNFMDQPNNCFLTGCDIKYNERAGLGVTYSNGAPIDVTLNLTFTEAEPLFREAETAKESKSFDDNSLTSTPYDPTASLAP